MHRCLSCNQPCSLFSAFCDTCRADLLARREQEIPEEQPEMVKVGGGSDGEGGYAGREKDEGMLDLGLLSFPQPEGPLVGSQSEAAQVVLPGPMEKDSSWTFETSGIYALETVKDSGEVEGAGEMEKQADVGQTSIGQATHVLAVPPRTRRTIPRNVRRALIVFCLVGILAFLTDGVLLALSISRHHTTAETHMGATSSNTASQQKAAPTSVVPTLTPVGTMQVSTTSMFALSAQRLAFSAGEGQTNLVTQTVTISVAHQGFAWRVEPTGTPPAWLRLSSWQGNVSQGAAASFVVSAHPSGLVPGLYTARLLVKAFDTQGIALAGSPEPLVVTLNVHQPCTLSVTPEKLSFVAVLVSAPAPQTITLSESSGCVFPVSWQVSSDENWVTFSRSSGIDSASGSTILVQASSAGKLIGSYTAHITFQGTDSSGAPLAVSPTVITTTLTVIA